MNDKPQYSDEFDFSDLLKHPAKLFGYSYIYLLFLLAVLGLMYLGDLTIVGKNSVVPSIVTDSAALVRDIPLQTPRILPPVDVLKAGVATPEFVRRGSDLYKANCSSCHGEDGQGDGLAGVMMNPKPRNFHSLAGWTNGSKISQMYKTLQEGIVKNGMASYTYLSPEDRFSLIHYVRTFASGQPGDSPEELKALDATYELSKGVNIPGQIPVRKAMEIIIREAAGDVQAVAAISAALSTSPAEGASILRRVTRDESKVITSLRHSRTSITTLNEFIRFVSADPIQHGFRTDVLRLTSPEWKALHAYTHRMTQ